MPIEKQGDFIVVVDSEFKATMSEITHNDLARFLKAQPVVAVGNLFTQSYVEKFDAASIEELARSAASISVAKSKFSPQPGSVVMRNDAGAFGILDFQTGRDFTGGPAILLQLNFKRTPTLDTPKAGSAYPYA